MNMPDPGAEALDAALDEIARTALESFPPQGRNWEPAVDFANRLLSKRSAKLRALGVELDASDNTAAREALAARIATLAPGYAPTPASRIAGWLRARFASAALQPTAVPPPPSDDEIYAAVDDAFSAAVDGTQERADVLTRRARSNVDRLLAARRVKGLAARRAYRVARVRIADNRADVVSGSR